MAQTLRFEKNHMLDHFHAKGPKFWWIVTSGLTHVLDHRNLPKAQRVLYKLDAHAYCFLIDTLSFDLMKQVNYKGTAREIWESIKHTFGDSSTWDDGKFKKEDDHKVEAHESVEHDHNLVIVKDCSTSWSSDNDDDATTKSLNKIDGVPQVMYMMILPHAHLMVMMVHARAMIVMLLQAHPLYHIASCHKVTPRYQIIMWL